MATTKQFFYRIDGSNNPISVAVRIIKDPGTILLNLDQKQIGNISDNVFPNTIIGDNSDLKGKTLVIFTNIFDFDPEDNNASVEVTLTGGIRDRVIDEPVVISNEDSVFLVFFISFIQPNLP